MARHILKLHYDGLRAARNELAPSASKQVIQGAQLLLGAHAHFYLNGVVPDRINDKSPGYEISDLARRAGSWETDFLINLLSNETSHLIHLAFDVFLISYMQQWKDGRDFADPAFERREPYFSSYGGVNEPFIDAAAEREHQLRRLSRRTGHAMAYLTAPNGTSSSTLEMSIDGRVIAVFDRRYPFYSEDEVAEAVSLFRESQPMKRPRGSQFN